MKGDLHNKIAMIILKSIENAREKMTIKWTKVHVGLEGNERADILAKDGARNGTYYSLQPKDAYRILEETQRDQWNNWYVLKAYFKVQIVCQCNSVNAKHELRISDTAKQRRRSLSGKKEKSSSQMV
jgi:hypothetical protein